jgi:hypothetical protein
MAARLVSCALGPCRHGQSTRDFRPPAFPDTGPLKQRAVGHRQHSQCHIKGPVKESHGTSSQRASDATY